MTRIPFRLMTMTLTTAAMITPLPNDTDSTGFKNEYSDVFMRGYSTDKNIFVNTVSTEYKISDGYFINDYSPQYHPVKRIDSMSAAHEFADMYSLIAVDEVSDLGITSGRLLCVSPSFEGLGEYIRTNGGFDNECLDFVTGINIL